MKRRIDSPKASEESVGKALDAAREHQRQRLLQQLNVSRMEKARLRLGFHYRLESEQIRQEETNGKGISLANSDFSELVVSRTSGFVSFPILRGRATKDR
jgi:hypothetical protein